MAATLEPALGGRKASARPLPARQSSNTSLRCHGSACRSSRWFVFGDGTSGILFDADSDRPASLDPYVLDDLDAALEIADSRGIARVLALLDYLFARLRVDAGNPQVQKGGRAGTITTYGTELVENDFSPLFDHFKKTTTILAWDVMNELELTRHSRSPGSLDWDCLALTWPRRHCHPDGC
jgi:hypothetical protein